MNPALGMHEEWTWGKPLRIIFKSIIMILSPPKILCKCLSTTWFYGDFVCWHHHKSKHQNWNKQRRLGVKKQKPTSDKLWLIYSRKATNCKKKTYKETSLKNCLSFSLSIENDKVKQKMSAVMQSPLAVSKFLFRKKITWNRWTDSLVRLKIKMK